MMKQEAKREWTPHDGVAIICCASCTANCIAPVIEILGRRIGVRKAIMTTVHAYCRAATSRGAAKLEGRRGNEASGRAG